MKNKSLISFVAIIVLIVGISGCVEDTQSSTNDNNQTMQNSSGNSNSSAADVKITSQEAKNIAKKYINKTGATPGDPLLKTDGDKVYIVPIVTNGNQAGEILIDAQTGEYKGSI